MSVAFNKKTRRYERDGKPIPPASIRKMVLATIERAKKRMRGIAAQLVNGTINRPAWFLASRNEVKQMHTALAMVAQGGRAQMNAGSWGRAGQMIRSEINYLRGFERDIANGVRSEVQILADAIKYSDAGYKLYSNMVLTRERELGTGYARRVLDESAAHCEDCPELATEEFVPITEVAEIGASSCGSFCRCDLEYADDMKSVKLVREVDEGPKQINIAYKLKGVESMTDAQVVITVNRPEA